MQRVEGYTPDYDLEAMEAKEGMIAGFDLAGQRREDGKIEVQTDGDQLILDDWPSSVVLLGNEYTFEYLQRSESGWENAFYV